MTPVDGQGELALVRQGREVELPVETIRRQRNAAAAFSLACAMSGLEDKEIYLALGIDAGHFSRIKKGDAGFPPDQVGAFCRLVNNTIYPEWIAFQLGCTLVLIESEAERRARESHERAEKLAAENHLMRQLLQGRAAAALN
jgi:hypothetical protein